MTNEEIAQAITDAVNNAVSNLQTQFTELEKTINEKREPPQLTPEEAFQQNMSASMNQWIEDKKTDRYGGKPIGEDPGRSIEVMDANRMKL